MRRLFTKAHVCGVLVVLTTLLLCSMVAAEEKRSVATEQEENKQLQQPEEKEEIEERTERIKSEIGDKEFYHEHISQAFRRREKRDRTSRIPQSRNTSLNRM